jgi:hypothetical protein
MPKTTAGLRRWRAKQPEGRIMAPSTFERIKRSAGARGARNPEAVAGAAYWRTARAKHRESKRARRKTSR